ncbi:hypothetical protein MZM54_02870 [[Brevibacterium] frigoritolerans]|nr:hypothetical protein [Peribacillus frigoritolerans]
MEWKELSRSARNILEWLENPYTGEFHTLSIVKFEQFLFARKANEYVSEELFDEIVEYLSGNINRYTADISSHLIKVKFTNQKKSLI